MAKAAAKPQPGKPPAKAAATPPPAAQPQQRAMPANGAKVAAERLSSPARPTQQARPAPQARPAQELRPGHQVRPAHQVRPVPAPSTPAAKPVQAAPKPVAAPAAEAGPKKPVTSRHGFRTNELIVYPAHGVGRIVGIEEQEIAGISLELFVIEFEKDKMTLRVPTTKLMNVGMRKLAEDGVLKKALETLKGKARIKRTMWSRRAQEYEAKINSGDLVAIAEVVRDLYRSEAQPEQSYSERQLYEAALDRMSRELAAVDKSDERSAMQRITEILAKSAKGRRAVEEEAQANAGDEGEVKAA